MQTAQGLGIFKWGLRERLALPSLDHLSLLALGNSEHARRIFQWQLLTYSLILAPFGSFSEAQLMNLCVLSKVWNVIVATTSKVCWEWMRWVLETNIELRGKLAYTWALYMWVHFSFIPCNNSKSFLPFILLKAFPSLVGFGFIWPPVS